MREKVLAGWPVSAIYQTHKPQLASIQYGQFRRYVRLYVGSIQRRSEPLAAPRLRPPAAEGRLPASVSPSDIAKYASRDVDLDALADVSRRKKSS